MGTGVVDSSEGGDRPLSPRRLAKACKTCCQTQFMRLQSLNHIKINSGWGFASDPTGGGYIALQIPRWWEGGLAAPPQEPHPASALRVSSISPSSLAVPLPPSQSLWIRSWLLSRQKGRSTSLPLKVS